MSLALIAQIGGILLGLNAIMSGVQAVFAAMSKAEPAWLQAVGKFLLSASQIFGGNTPNNPPPSAPAGK